MAANYFRTWPSKIPHWLIRMVINMWPPYLGTGITVKTIAPDYRYIEVHMSLHWYNKNMVGTQFGGSMYSMTDPFYMLMLIKNLGPNYIVWDKAASIDFKKPGVGRLRAMFKFSAEEIATIRKQADENVKYIFDRPVDLLNDANEVVASVIKTLYVRKKDPQ